jgi:hypothetical protein
MVPVSKVMVSMALLRTITLIAAPAMTILLRQVISLNQLHTRPLMAIQRRIVRLISRRMVQKVPGERLHSTEILQAMAHPAEDTATQHHTALRLPRMALHQVLAHTEDMVCPVLLVHMATVLVLQWAEGEVTAEATVATEVADTAEAAETIGIVIGIEIVIATEIEVVAGAMVVVAVVAVVASMAQAATTAVTDLIE